jgi:hypothetical protein
MRQESSGRVNAWRDQFCVGWASYRPYRQADVTPRDITTITPSRSLTTGLLQRHVEVARPGQNVPAGVAAQPVEDGRDMVVRLPAALSPAGQAWLLPPGAPTSSCVRVSQLGITSHQLGEPEGVGGRFFLGCVSSGHWLDDHGEVRLPQEILSKPSYAVKLTKAGTRHAAGVLDVEPSRTAVAAVVVEPDRPARQPGRNRPPARAVTCP